MAAGVGGLLFEVFQSVLLVVRPESGDEVFLQAGGGAGPDPA
jgi:hypothetical protein